MRRRFGKLKKVKKLSGDINNEKNIKQQNTG